MHRAAGTRRPAERLFRTVQPDAEGAAMRGKMMFVGGLAVGFVLGSRAGRQAYDELARSVRKVRDNPTVQEAAGVVQEQATKLYTQGKETVTDKLGHTRLGERLLQGGEGDPVTVGTNSASKPSTDGGL